MPAQLYLVRHGETAWSLSGQHTGRTDLPLTDAGRKRAGRLRERLRGIAFSRVLTSPLQRARQTCELAGLGAGAKVEPDLHEWDYGAYEGRTTAEIHAEQPDWNVFQHGGPGGETVEQIQQRADRLLAGLRAGDGPVALFSHGHVLRALAARWIGLPVGQGRHFALDTGSLSLLGYEHSDRGNPAILLWNSQSILWGGIAAPSPLGAGLKNSPV